MLFHVGDRVKNIKYDYRLYEIGIIKKITGDNVAAVEFNSPDEYCHNCDRSCRDGYGLWIPINDLEVVNGKITLEEFFEMPCAVIHCNTEDKAIELLTAFKKMDKRWCDDDEYNACENNFNVFKENTFYSNDGQFFNLEDVRKYNFKVLDFEEIDLNIYKQISFDWNLLLKQ